MRHTILLMVLTMFIWSCSGSKEAVNSTLTLEHHSFEELDSLMEKEERPVVVFLHAEWCKYCRNMEETTFKHPEVVKLLNEQFYFISFDGEQKEPVAFRGRQFNYVPNGRTTGTHELALALGGTNGELLYPTLLLLNPEMEIIFEYASFLSHTEVLEVLKS